MSFPATFVQVIDFGNTGTATSIVSGSYTLTAGNRVVLWAIFANAADVATGCTDTNGNSWAKVPSSFSDASSGMTYVLYECRKVTVGGSTAITVALSSSCTHRGLAGAEYAKLDGTSAVQDSKRQRQLNPGATTDAIATPLLTPTYFPALLVSLAQEQGGATAITAGTGETLHYCPNCTVINGQSYTVIQEKRVTSLAQLQATATCTLGASRAFASWGVLISENITANVLVGQSGDSWLTPTGGTEQQTGGNAFYLHTGYLATSGTIDTAWIYFGATGGGATAAKLSLYDSSGNVVISSNPITRVPNTLCSGSLAGAGSATLVADVYYPVVVSDTGRMDTFYNSGGTGAFVNNQLTAAHFPYASPPATLLGVYGATSPDVTNIGHEVIAYFTGTASAGGGTADPGTFLRRGGGLLGPLRGFGRQ